MRILLTIENDYQHQVGGHTVMSKRKITLKNNLTIVFILILSTLLVGCSNNNNGESTSKGSHDNMLTIAWPRDVGEMNPHVYNPSQLFAQSMVSEPLVSNQAGGTIKPRLAQ